jgi:hypothetical protein
MLGDLFIFTIYCKKNKMFMQGLGRSMSQSKAIFGILVHWSINTYLLVCIFLLLLTYLTLQDCEFLCCNNRNNTMCVHLNVLVFFFICLDWPKCACIWKRGHKMRIVSFILISFLASIYCHMLNMNDLDNCF